MTFQNEKGIIQLRVLSKLGMLSLVVYVMSGCATMQTSLNRTEQQLKQIPLFGDSILNNKSHPVVPKMANEITALEKKYGADFDNHIQKAMDTPEIQCKDSQINNLKKRLDDEIKRDIVRHYLQKNSFYQSNQIELKAGRAPDSKLSKSFIYFYDWDTKVISASCENNRLDTSKPIEFKVEYKTEIAGISKKASVLKPNDEHQVEVTHHRSVYQVDRPRVWNNILFISSPTRILKIHSYKNDKIESTLQTYPIYTNKIFGVMMNKGFDDTMRLSFKRIQDSTELRQVAFTEYAENLIDSTNVFKLLEISYVNHQQPNELKFEAIYNNDQIVMGRSYNLSDRKNLILNGPYTINKIVKLNYFDQLIGTQPEFNRGSGASCYYNAVAVQVDKCMFWTSEKVVAEAKAKFEAEERERLRLRAEAAARERREAAERRDSFLQGMTAVLGAVNTQMAAYNETQRSSYTPPIYIPPVIPKSSSSREIDPKPTTNTRNVSTVSNASSNSNTTTARTSSSTTNSSAQQKANELKQQQQLKAEQAARAKQLENERMQREADLAAKRQQAEQERKQREADLAAKRLQQEQERKQKEQERQRQLQLEQQQKQQARANFLESLKSNISLSARTCPGGEGAYYVVGNKPQSRNSDPVSCINITYEARCPGQVNPVVGTGNNFIGISTGCFAGDTYKIPAKMSCEANKVSVRVREVRSCY